jgi:hypothetical protein
MRSVVAEAVRTVRLLGVRRLPRTTGHLPSVCCRGCSTSTNRPWTACPLIWGFLVERVTGIEPALSAWESARLPQVRVAELGILMSASYRDCP